MYVAHTKKRSWLCVEARQLSVVVRVLFFYFDGGRLVTVVLWWKRVDVAAKLLATLLATYTY